jgi:fucose 4-O-acetylase-like acetyltransferase
MKTNIIQKQRLIDIDITKGFAIFLVVIGHIVSSGNVPKDNDWYYFLQLGIYKFHMPLFMYLSGIIFTYTYPKVNNISSYLNYVIKKIQKFWVSYLLFALLIYIGKKILSSTMYIDDIPGDFYSEIKMLLIEPSKSAGGSLWFIYVLIEMYISVPIILMLIKNRIILIFIGVFFYFIKMPSIFLLDRYFNNFLYFLIGVLVYREYEKYLSLIDKYFIIIFFSFLISFFLIGHVLPTLSKFIISLLSLFAIHGIVRKNIIPLVPFWLQLSKYTYSIYLMNTIFIGLIKGIFFLHTTWDGSNFLLISPVLLFSGVFFPIITKKYVIVKVHYIDKATN